jgi:predicted DsbA family dithiol-disulfide isomerase
LAHKLAIANPHVAADVVEVSEFPEVAQRYQIYGVPKTVINDRVEFEGALPEAAFVEQVLRAVSDADDVQAADEQEGGDGSNGD